VDVFFKEKGISMQPYYENEIFCQGKHVKEKDPSIDIHEEIYFHMLVDVIGADQGEVDQHLESSFHLLVLSTDIQPDVSSCKTKKALCYQPSKFCHLFYDM
jgi:hypothetical protein